MIRLLYAATRATIDTGVLLGRAVRRAWPDAADVARERGVRAGARTLLRLVATDLQAQVGAERAAVMARGKDGG